MAILLVAAFDSASEMALPYARVSLCTHALLALGLVMLFFAIIGLVMFDDACIIIQYKLSYTVLFAFSPHQIACIILHL
jgi:hypothetical protein